MTPQLPAAGHSKHERSLFCFFYARKPTINNTVFKAAAIRATSPIQRAPLTLVGSPPAIHLLQWKSNTMDLQLSFLAVGQKTQRAEVGRK